MVSAAVFIKTPATAVIITFTAAAALIIMGIDAVGWIVWAVLVMVVVVCFLMIFFWLFLTAV